MKNLKSYSGDCFDVHKKAVDKKHTGDLKDRLIKLNPSVEAVYKIFMEKFELNQLTSIIPNSTLSLSKEDLLTLYNYQSSVIISVRETIRKLQVNTIIATCQNCTIDSANSFDHILPKSNFPEFVVNPKNLFPCCSTCNSYKVDSVNSGIGQMFLNLYLDDLPKQHYLFVDISFDQKDYLDFNFHLKNIDNKIEANLFSAIESHFYHLHLLERMKLKSIEYVSELETKIKTFKHRLPIDDIITDLINAVELDMAAYGENHWKCVLESTLLNDKIFVNKFR